MARIRSIKPEFFDDEDLCAFGPWHRLCFAGLWTQADKAGRIEDRPRRLKTRIFPYDDLDFESLLKDLATSGFIVRYVVEGKHYICIPEDSWDEHQRPRKDEHESSFPSVSCAEDTYLSLNSDVSVTTECLGSRKVGSRKVGGEEGAAAPTVAARGRADDLQEIWNTATTPPIPRCRELTPARRQKIAARLRERPVESWADVIARIEASPFCRGKNDRNWKASFDWLIDNADNAVKVLEGKYDGPRATRVNGVEVQPDYRSREYECHHSPQCGSARIHENALAMGRLEVPA
jgi:hypothetical protein